MNGGHKKVQINYGLLERIMVFTLPDTPIFDKLQKIQVLILVRPCQTEGKDAAVELTQYRSMPASVVTDIRNVKGVIGRAASRGQWGIIDRSLNIAPTVFHLDDMLDINV
jgi:hypothetical protein